VFLCHKREQRIWIGAESGQQGRMRFGNSPVQDNAAVIEEYRRDAIHKLEKLRAAHEPSPEELSEAPKKCLAVATDHYKTITHCVHLGIFKAHPIP